MDGDLDVGALLQCFAKISITGKSQGKLFVFEKTSLGLICLVLPKM